jgi:hypothetical protein
MSNINILKVEKYIIYQSRETHPVPQEKKNKMMSAVNI